MVIMKKYPEEEDLDDYKKGVEYCDSGDCRCPKDRHDKDGNCMNESWCHCKGFKLRGEQSEKDVRQVPNAQSNQGSVGLNPSENCSPIKTWTALRILEELEEYKVIPKQQGQARGYYISIPSKSWEELKRRYYIVQARGRWKFVKKPQ